MDLIRQQSSYCGACMTSGYESREAADRLGRSKDAVQTQLSKLVCDGSFMEEMDAESFVLASHVLWASYLARIDGSYRQDPATEGTEAVLS